MRYLLLAFFITTLFSGCASTSEILKNSDGTAAKVKMDVYRAFDKKTAPTILLAHGSGGVSASHHAWAKDINSWGYNVIVIDHYTLRGIQRHTGQVAGGATTKDRARDMIDVARWVNKQTWHYGRIGAIGFSQGGGGILALVKHQAMERNGWITKEKPNPISFASAVYPACFFESPPDKPSMPTQMLLAEKDDLARPEFCQPFNTEIYEAHVLANATHSFDENIPGSVRLIFTHRYDSKTTDEAKKLVRIFFDRNSR